MFIIKNMEVIFKWDLKATYIPPPQKSGIKLRR